MRPTNRPRPIRPRTDALKNYDDIDFFKTYRMSKCTVTLLLHQLEGDLKFDSNRNESVAPIQQLLIALRFYATGTHLQAIADAHRVSVPTVSRVVRKVSRAIVKLQPKYIKMPATTAEIENCQREFNKIANFPFIIGSIDCTHVKIQSPGGGDAEKFRNRKGYFSINVQTVSDSNLKVTNVVAHCPGSTNDSDIFINSQLCHDFEMGVYGSSCLLGDSGYPLKNYLLTPYLHPNSQSQEQYNYSHIRTRNTVERQYRVLKQRFPALAIGLRINLYTAVDVIVACCILHNICIDEGEDIPPQEMDNSFLDAHIEDGQIDHYYADNNRNEDIDNEAARAVITHNFFS
ncbi:putative nuclease HARBI1 isoform X2 [Pararge aegeria]|nr:putative nuclease HARBI1 isoform X2 [Pararge aegeria]